MSTTRSFSDFRELSCVLLGAITGALIGLPWSVSVGANYAALLVVAFAILGGMVGYRQRKSTAFFYLCLISIIALASLLSSHFVAQG